MDLDTRLDEGGAQEVQAPAVTPTLLLDVGVVLERHARSQLHGAGHHQPGVLAHLGEEANELGVADVEASAQAGQVRPLRERVHGDHPVETVLDDRVPRSGPRELDVALVAEHGDAVGPAPCGGVCQVVDRTCRVGGRVDPETQGLAGVVRADRGQVEVPARVDVNGHRPAPGQHCTHGIRGIGDSGIEDGVLLRVAQAQEVGHAGHELLRAHARGQISGNDVHAEAAVQPPGGCLSERRRADGGRVARFGARRSQGRDHGRRRRVARRPHRQVDESALMGGGQRLEGVQPVVGIGRGPKTGHEEITNSSKRPAPPVRKRARRTAASASWDSDSTSPSRCRAASTSPRS